MIEIEYLGGNALVSTEDVSFTFESAENPRDFEKYNSPQQSLDWTDQDYQIGDYRVFPYGTNNDLPKVIKDVVGNNSLVPGILKKKSQLIWGKGPQLYTEEIKEGVLTRTWTQDKAVQKWLDSWDCTDYLLKSLVDYSHIEGTFTKFNMSKGMRIGRPSIASLEHISAEDGRLATDLEDYKPKAKYCIITDWTFSRLNSLDYTVYNLFDFLNPFKSRTSVLYSNMYSFCSDYYTIPDLYGSLEWIRRSTAIPLIIKALSKNSINLKYHVISPARFWEKKKEELEKEAQDKGEKYDAKQLVKFKSDYLRKVSKVLSGAENTGKFWHSIKYVTVEGHKIFEEGWEIKEIKQNIKDFVKAQIEISEHSNRMVGASVGMHPALGGAGESGRADSGSEQLYALKNYLLTGIDIPETIIMKPINYALKLNFPTKDLKLGFYHMVPQKEEDITEKDRPKNQV